MPALQFSLISIKPAFVCLLLFLFTLAFTAHCLSVKPFFKSSLFCAGLHKHPHARVLSPRFFQTLFFCQINKCTQSELFLYVLNSVCMRSAHAQKKTLDFKSHQMDWPAISFCPPERGNRPGPVGSARGPLGADWHGWIYPRAQLPITEMSVGSLYCGYRQNRKQEMGNNRMEWIKPPSCWFWYVMLERGFHLNFFYVILHSMRHIQSILLKKTKFK